MPPAYMAQQEVPCIDLAMAGLPLKVRLSHATPPMCAQRATTLSIFAASLLRSHP